MSVCFTLSKGYSQAVVSGVSPSQGETGERRSRREVSGFVVGFQFAVPDVSVADGIAMILKEEPTARRMR